ncbi:TadE/TadG family type IV pilus assembly protein [Roseibium sp.]|uniref:TadE/TadG family type IV pilus assembly protein n=1 Tax=Roseibium sp. TaxID=1936156 RepID=UPI003D130D01
MFRSDKSKTAGTARQPAGRTRKNARAGFFPACFFRDQRGVSAVEMALVFPVFLMIVFGILEIGYALKTWNEVNNALGRAVRLVNIDADTSPDDIAAAMRSYLTNVDADTLTVAATPVTITGTDYIKIEVDFPFEVILPFTTISSMTINVDRIAPILSATK